MNARMTSALPASGEGEFLGVERLAVWRDRMEGDVGHPCHPPGRSPALQQAPEQLGGPPGVPASIRADVLVAGQERLVAQLHFGVFIRGRRAVPITQWQTGQL